MDLKNVALQCTQIVDWCVNGQPTNMPLDFTTFHAQCGLFYCTFTSFTTKHVFHSQCRFVKLVPRLSYFPSPKGLYLYNDCALFNFSYVKYTYDESCTNRKAHFKIVTMVCVSMFLACLLLMHGCGEQP